MPEHLRALLVILALATAIFALAKNPACAMAFTSEDFKRRRNLWYGVTCAAFLAHNFWLYIVATTILLLVTVPREKNKIALFFFILFAVPTTAAEISGMGIINHFFAINYPRLLSLTILLPAYLYLREQPDTDAYGSLLPDKLIGGYLALMCVLIFLASTFTHALRAGIFYAFLDVFLPYYVASRSLKNLQAFREAIMAFVIAALILSIVGVFEYAKYWLLYSSLETALGVESGYGNYLQRGDGILRAQASTGHAIPLGFVIAVAIGLYLFLRKSIPNSGIWALGMVLLIAGLLSPVSRGPWVGAAAIVFIFTLTSRSPGKMLAKLGGLLAVFVPVLLFTSGGQKFIDLLPFVGTTSTETVGYRQLLIDIAISVILQNPFFGAFDYMLSPEMQQMKQGQGIIDIVNSYISITLSSGLVGLSLFCGFFITVAAGIFNAMRKLEGADEETRILGQALLATLIGILLIIFTTSSITIIPVVYWSIAGLGVGFARMAALSAKASKTLQPPKMKTPPRLLPATARARP